MPKIEHGVGQLRQLVRIFKDEGYIPKQLEDAFFAGDKSA